MATPAPAFPFGNDPGVLDSDAVLNALAAVIVVIDPGRQIRYVNSTGEQFLRGSSGHLLGRDFSEFLPVDNPAFGLIEQARAARNTVSEYRVTLDSPRIGRHYVNIQAAPVGDGTGNIVLAIQERSLADAIDRQLTHKGAARSVTAMAAMLAHEVKNPLSGIRGAAQLMESTVGEDDKELTRLIQEEVDRICDMVDQMDAFYDRGPPKREAVNIHLVLDRVRQLAQNGFGRHIQFIERYDPSLPPVLGNRDQLTQVILNLVKNAAEAAPEQGGEILLQTAYRHGIRFAVPGSESRVHLPLLISVQDNGPGIAEDIRPHLFDPFVSSKPEGKGLGMALVAKIIDDHGGVIEFESRPRRTVFKLMLPMAEGETDDAPEDASDSGEGA